MQSCNIDFSRPESPHKYISAQKEIRCNKGWMCQLIHPPHLRNRCMRARSTPRGTFTESRVRQPSHFRSGSSHQGFRRLLFFRANACQFLPLLGTNLSQKPQYSLQYRAHFSSMLASEDQVPIPDSGQHLPVGEVTFTKPIHHVFRVAACM